MEITELNVYPLQTDISPPSWTAQGRKSTAKLTLFEVVTDNGHTGYGEVQSGPQSTVCEYAKMFGSVVRGSNPLSHADIWTRLLSTTHPRPGGLGGWDGLPGPLPRGDRSPILAAIGGIDIALWDLKGKITTLPVFRLLGGEKREIFTYATGGFYVEGKSHAEYAADFAEYVDQGYSAVKVKTGALSIEEEADRIGQIRDAIGPDPLLMLDMNAAHDIDGCVDFAEAMAPHDIYWLEEPIHWYYQPGDFATLADKISIPLAHGERLWHRRQVRDFIDAGGLEFVQFDSTRRAGFTESLRVAEYAAQHDVSIAPHTAPHIHGHLVSAYPSDSFGVESHGQAERHPIQGQIYDGGPDLVDDCIQIPDKPGFGVTIDWDAVERLSSE